MIGPSQIQLMQPHLLKHAGVALAVCQRSREVSWDGTIWIRGFGA